MGCAGAHGYLFADSVTGGDQHDLVVDYLAEVYDPLTFRTLGGVEWDRSGQGLEVGSGSGTVARWLAEQTHGPGRVTAVDIKPRSIRSHPRLIVQAHDIVTQPLRGRTYSVIHSRATLVHLRERTSVLAKLADALAPGGVLVIGEFLADGWRDCVLDAPDRAEAQALADGYHAALIEVMRSGGSDPRWGLMVPAAMRSLGLTDVRCEVGGSRSWRGGEPGCMLPAAMTRQLGSGLNAAGMPEHDLVRFRELLLSPDLLMRNPLMIATVGRKAR